MAIDYGLIFGIIGSVGGLFGIISILWSIRKHREEKTLKIEEFKSSIRPNMDIEYREIKRVTSQGKNFLLGEITITNKTLYEVLAAGFGISISGVKLKDLPTLTFKNKEDKDSNKITLEFGKTKLLVELGLIIFYGHLYDLYHTTGVEERGQMDTLLYSTLKYSLEKELKKYFYYTLDPGIPIVLPVIFQYSGNGFYKLSFTCSLVPTGADWRSKAEALGIEYQKPNWKGWDEIIERDYSKEKIEVEEIPRLTFMEEFVRHLDSESVSEEPKSRVEPQLSISRSRIDPLTDLDKPREEPQPSLSRASVLPLTDSNKLVEEDLSKLSLEELEKRVDIVSQEADTFIKKVDEPLKTNRSDESPLDDFNKLKESLYSKDKDRGNTQ